MSKYNEGKYILPNDIDERNRLDLQHQLFNLTFQNKLLLCPAPDTFRSCLDIGTGTGNWATDFADLHPECNVIGVDLSAIQPQYAPPNCKWEIDDLEQDWTYPQKFDLIHARMLTASFEDWPKFFRQSFAALEPGGWLEMQDFCLPTRTDDDSMPSTCALARWNEMMVRGGRISGRGMDVPDRYDEWMREVGFENVTKLVYKWPQNPWPKDSHAKELGRWNLGEFRDVYSVLIIPIHANKYSSEHVGRFARLFDCLVYEVAGNDRQRS